MGYSDLRDDRRRPGVLAVDGVEHGIERGNVTGVMTVK
jgi:hypothetical protein